MRLRDFCMCVGIAFAYGVLFGCTVYRALWGEPPEAPGKVTIDPTGRDWPESEVDRRLREFWAVVADKTPSPSSPSPPICAALMCDGIVIQANASTDGRCIEWGSGAICGDTLAELQAAAEMGGMSLVFTPCPPR